MEAKRITPLKAIRLKCLDCSSDSPKEVRQCPAANCPLHPFRMGKNPKRLGKDENGYCGAENSGTISDFSEDALREG